MRERKERENDRGKSLTGRCNQRAETNDAISPFQSCEIIVQFS